MTDKEMRHVESRHDFHVTTMLIALVQSIDLNYDSNGSLQKMQLTRYYARTKISSS